MPRILVVDDDVPSQEFIMLALMEEGYDVTTACNGNEGLDRVRAYHLDLILLDLYMPLVNGERFLELYRDITGKKVPVIGFSASGRSGARMMQMGVDDFLAKPFNLDDLLNCVKKHLQIPAA